MSEGRKGGNSNSDPVSGLKVTESFAVYVSLTLKCPHVNRLRCSLATAARDTMSQVSCPFKHLSGK